MWREGVDPCLDGGTDEVEGWVEENPNEVYVMPIDGGSLDAPMPLGREITFSTPIPNDENQNYTAQNMQRVQSGHCIKNGSKCAVSRLQMATPFDADHANQECNTQ